MVLPALFFRPDFSLAQLRKADVMNTQYRSSRVG
jgi:hypothetical protein